MTPTDWLLSDLTAAVLIAGLSIAAAVRQAGTRVHHAVHETGRRQGEAMAFVKGVILDAAPAIKGLNRDIPAGLTRLGVAADKIADEKPAQQQATKYLELSEKLIVGISEVLNHELEHPEGLKDDVVVGRNQGAEIVKELLQNELVNAQK